MRGVWHRLGQAPLIESGGAASMSFCLSFHLALPGLSGAHWLDDPPDLNCEDDTQQHAVDDPLLSCKQQPLAE